MKYLFGINKREGIDTIKSFALRNISDGRKTKLDGLLIKNKQLKRKKTVPYFVAHIGICLTPIGVVGVLAMLCAEDGFQYALERIPWAFYFIMVSLVIGPILLSFYFIRNAKAKKDPEILNCSAAIGDAISDSCTELDIPENCQKMDVFYAAVKENKKGKEIIKKFSFNSCVNKEMYVFVENDYLCFANNYFVAGIPLESIVEIKEIHRPISLRKWNKKEEISSGKYLKYLIYAPRQGVRSAKRYYVVNILFGSKNYYFYLPNYEIDSFKKLIGQ